MYRPGPRRRAQDERPRPRAAAAPAEPPAVAPRVGRDADAEAHAGRDDDPPPETSSMNRSRTCVARRRVGRVPGEVRGAERDVVRPCGAAPRPYHSIFPSVAAGCRPARRRRRASEHARPLRDRVVARGRCPPCRRRRARRPSADPLDRERRRRRVEPHLVRDVDRPARVVEVHARAIDALGGTATVPDERDGTGRKRFGVCDRRDSLVVLVDDRDGQPVGVAKPEPDPRLAVRRALADRRERLRHLRRDDRRRDELQPLGDRERRRGSAEQAQNEKGRQEARQPAREAIRRPSSAWGEHALARPPRARAAGLPHALPGPRAPLRSPA